ncbi:PadR family transcriptional regulator [Nesterenkonia ebinurensis]|uniref:PadR family transcriptional regulator n=1 Tax=Nesterenkonia ebinurensis TaxID=2608252 RepID=UPI00123DFA05|nr:PadR family transcriptional regulator [Nesterenkonia ebinurensis]
MIATKLLVLGSVRELGQAHGYQVRRDLGTRGVHLWANIRQGSIYHALKKLTVDGLLEVATETAATSSGPARTKYVLTKDGERAFFELLEQSLRSHEGDIADTITGIGFMTELPRPRVIELLEERVDAYRAWREQVVGEYEGTQEDWLHHVEAIRLWAHTADSSITWTQGLIARLQRGDYTMANETPQAQN